MKSRTSFFNGTILKKNITRFAPVWALYGVFLLLHLIGLADDTTAEFARNLVWNMQGRAVINFCHALLCAIVLFGDLYKSRMCNALHALPINRECWFFTNVISGLLFSLVPNVAFALVCLPFVGGLTAVPFLWLLVASLQYIFFFGTAVLAVYCAGNRPAMVLVYCIINLAAGIFYALADVIYVPMMNGVWITGNGFRVLMPVLAMGENSYAEVSIVRDIGVLQMHDGWGYLAICAAVGIGFMALALQIYRRRNLEVAGDFLAIRRLRPVFIILYSLAVGVCFSALLMEIFALMILGIAVGVYTGYMLLERTVRVFRKKTFLMFISLTGAFILSVAVVGLDTFGIVRWVPKASDIATVEISPEGSYGNRQTMTTPEEVEDVLMMHRQSIDWEPVGEARVERLFIAYTLHNGRVVYREYSIGIDTEAGQCLKEYASNPVSVLGDIYTENRPVRLVEIPDVELIIHDEQDIQQLLDAVLADCKEANLPQNWYMSDEVAYKFWIELEYDTAQGKRVGHSIRASSDAKHVWAWLEQHGIGPEDFVKYSK